MPEYFLVPCIFLIMLLITPNAPALAQPDTVVSRSQSGKNAKRRGTIVEWKGGSLSIQSGSRTRDIDNHRIVGIQTSWHDSYEKAKPLLDAGKPVQAIVLFREALSNENRTWAQNIIRAELVRAYSASEQHAEAIREFVRILATDPQTRFMSFIPLPWSGSSGNTAVRDIARELIDSREPAAKLIGASWLTSGNDRAKAIQVLEKLAKDFEPEIAYLALAQLWRTETGIANRAKLDRWNQKILEMPKPLRAGPYFVLANAQANSKLADSAALNWMRIPILFPDQSHLCAASLYKCAKLMQNDGQTKQAQTLWTELLSKYPNSIWAKQIDPSQLQE